MNCIIIKIYPVYNLYVKDSFLHFCPHMENVAYENFYLFNVRVKVSQKVGRHPYNEVFISRSVIFLLNRKNLYETETRRVGRSAPRVDFVGGTVCRTAAVGTQVFMHTYVLYI